VGIWLVFKINFLQVQSTSASGRGCSSHYPSLPPPITATSSASLVTPAPVADSAVHVKRAKPQPTKVLRVNSPGYRSPRGRSTPSPPGCRSSVGGSVRGSPYHSPRDSPRGGSLRGLSKHSNQSSPRSSAPNSPSPPPALSHGSPPSSPQGPRSSGPPREPSPKPSTQQLSSESQSTALDFESGQVVGQLPYEYSSFLDLPPSALGQSRLLVIFLLSTPLCRTVWVGRWPCPRCSPGCLTTRIHRQPQT